MGSSIAEKASSRQRVIAEIQPEMVKVDLRKTGSADCLAEIGECLDFARRSVGWTLDQLARSLPPPAGKETRDPRQVQRWIDGEERCQVDVVFAVEVLRAPFVIALAQKAAQDDSGVVVTTGISIRHRRVG